MDKKFDAGLIAAIACDRILSIQTILIEKNIQTREDFYVQKPRASNTIMKEKIKDLKIGDIVKSIRHLDKYNLGGIPENTIGIIEENENAANDGAGPLAAFCVNGKIRFFNVYEGDVIKI